MVASEQGIGKSAEKGALLSTVYPLVPFEFIPCAPVTYFKKYF